jgi:hypothetical protein
LLKNYLADGDEKNNSLQIRWSMLQLRAIERSSLCKVTWLRQKGTVTVKIRCSQLLQYTKLKAICQEKYGEIIHVAKYSFTRISVRIVYHVLALKNWTVQRTVLDWWLMHAYIFYTCTVAWKMPMQILCINHRGSNFILNFRLLLIMEINLLF